ncbi:polycystin-1-like protein 2 [Leuresthes tenuis]|uniref:polycystin-1-like protein 2 n=1 Tax=Leuresthes tenuis TaxID=355514 RepID=UPI003B50D232
MYLSTHEPADLGNAVLGSESDGYYFKLPSYSALAPHLKNHKKISTQVATFSSNPYPSDDNITGTVCSIQLSDGKSEIKLENLEESIEIFLHHPNSSTVMNNTFVLKRDSRLLTEFNISDPETTIIFNIKPSIDVSLSLLLSYGLPPNSTHFSNRITMNTTDGYRWMITPEMLLQTPGTWYIDTRLENDQSETDVVLTITSYLSKCMYWHTGNESWSTYGCRVGNKSTPEHTQCLCNHLTLFGSSFFVMPNHVDISRTAELFATVSENYVVLALLCAFFGLYLITLLWACYADRKSRSKRKMTLLKDNHPGALYNYLISVQTGHRKNAGTSANVTVKLTGSDGESSIHNLTDPDKPVFERGATDMFLLATPFPLGEVQNIRLQHDNSGGHPSWYINKVTIQDLQTRQVWQFLCGCWLSKDREDGMTKKTFNAAKSNEIASFRNIFHSRTSTGFRDEHIWVSIVDPPSRSPFTRAQRVSCCMSLLLCTMAINIAFWNIPVNEKSPVLFSLGSLHITWQEIMVGVQSGLLMFPINILIITIFRSIRPRVISKSQKGDPEDNFRPPAVTIPSILKETEEVLSLVSRSPRNKMSEMLCLESTADLCPALDRLHILIQHMQGESESNNHWVYCSKFLLAGFCHLLMCLEKLDGKNFPSPQDYQQALSFTNLLVRKAEMVFSSHLSNCPPPVRKKKKRSAGFRLPWWCVFVGWFLLVSISVISTYFTLLYGFEYGREKSIKWVMSLGLSLFESIFILQPLKVIGVAVFFALLMKPVAVEDTEEVEQVLLEQEEKCRGYTGRFSL